MPSFARADYPTFWFLTSTQAEIEKMIRFTQNKVWMPGSSAGVDPRESDQTRYALRYGGST